MATYLIHSIYKATEGEGRLIGRPQIFVRFQGCAIGCLNCDSKDTWDFNPASEMAFEQVVSSVMTLSRESSPSLKRLSITGGDPLHPKHVPAVLELIQTFKEKGFFINLEASGSRIVDEIFNLVDFISFDFKTPSTGVKTSIELIKKLNQEFSHKAQIKAVVETPHDFQAVLEARQILGEELQLEWCLTPAYNPGEKFPMNRFQEILKWNEKVGGPFFVIGQQHKWVYGPNERLV